MFKILRYAIQKAREEQKNYRMMSSLFVDEHKIGILSRFIETSPDRNLLANQIYKMAFYGDSANRIIIRIKKAKKRRK